MENSRRPWWKKLLILLSGPAILFVLMLVVFAVFERGSEQTAESWDEDVSDAFIYYIDYYVIPVEGARAGNPPCDEASLVGTDNRACERFVQAMSERQDELHRAADKFESLATTAPEDTPAELTQPLRDTADALRLFGEADLLLAAGWSSQDQAEWELGWQRRSEARAALRALARKSDDTDSAQSTH